MESKKIKQLSQRYSENDVKKIEEKAKAQHLDVATFIRKCVLDEVNK